MKKLLFLAGLWFVLSLPVYAYSDVPEDHIYKDGINYITELGIVQGYDDGSYRPENTINRAEFTKILVEATLGENPFSFAEGCFDDFTIDKWFSSYVCYAKSKGIISGYPDGSFGPEKSINAAEASKILVNVFGLTLADTSGEDWYSPYIDTMIAEKYIPADIEYVNSEITRGEMAEMIWRIMEQKHDRPAASALQNSPCQDSGEDLPSNINMDEVRDTWLEWNNQERRSLGLHEYILNDQLNRTAISWSKISRDRGYINHKRDSWDAYYDYYKIKSWFAGLGIEFRGGLYTENIAWEMYYCDASEADCTQQMIDAIRKGFNFFMSEKGGSYTAHYDSIISPNYNIIGLGIAVDDAANKYYLTVHYGSEIVSDPMRICD